MIRDQNKILFTWIIPVLLFTLNLITKTLYLDFPAIGGDEPFTLFYAQMDYDSLWTMLKQENNPPLFTILMKYWIEMFGLSPFAVRMLPAIFASLTPIFIFKIGIRLSTLKAGLIAAIFFTFSTYHVQFAHETRPYALFALLTAAAIYYYLCYIEEKKLKYGLLLALFNTLLIYNHFFGFFVFFIQLLGIFTLKGPEKPIRRMILPWGISLLLYLPYLPIIVERFTTASTSGTWVGPPVFGELYNNLVKFSNAPVIISSILLLIVAMSIYILLKQNQKKDKLFFLLAWAFVPYLVMFFVSFKIPMFLDRYLVFVTIGFYLLIPFLITSIPNKNLLNSCGLIVLSMMIITVNLRAGNKEADDKIVAILKEHRKDSETTIVSPDYYKYNFAYHYSKEYFSSPLNTFDHLENEKIYAVDLPEQLKLYDVQNCDSLFFIGKGSFSSKERNAVLTVLDTWYVRENVLYDDGNSAVVLFTGRIY